MWLTMRNFTIQQVTKKRRTAKMNYEKERPVSTSISLEPSKLNDLKRLAFEKSYKSRNDLIASILTNWLEKENKKRSA